VSHATYMTYDLCRWPMGQHI